MRFLKLIRWQNILLIIASQCLIKFALFPSFNLSLALNLWQFALLVIATICLAAAGNIINDIYDIETDTINKPNKVIIGKTVSERLAYNLFIGLNITGVLLGFYLSHSIEKSAFFVLFVIISILLYSYTTYLKGTILIGNIVISILVGLSLLIVGIFDIIPAITYENQYEQRNVFKIVLAYATLAFLINLIREIIKDIEDINGDYKTGLRTLPIVIGRHRSSIIAALLTCIPLGIVLYYVIIFLYQKPLAVVYYAFFIIGPLIYIIINVYSAKSKQNYHHISTVLKLIMVTGLLSLCLYPLNLC